MVAAVFWVHVAVHISMCYRRSGVKRSGDSELPYCLDPFLGTGDIKKNDQRNEWY